MTIWHRVSGLYGSLKGGWKTYGPNAIEGSGAFDDSTGDFEHSSVTAEMAARLSAVRSCVALRAEIVASLPLHLRDKNKNIIHDHDLSRLLMLSPNADQTTPEFWSLASAMIDLHGNSVNIIERTGKRPIALTPCNPLEASFEYNKSGKRKTWKIGKDTVHDDDVLHLRGFSLASDWGSSSLDLGRQIIKAQLEANKSAQRAFRQGLKVGGFFINERTSDLTTEQLTQLTERLNFFGRAENAGRWMTLMRGLKPVAGTEFAVKPSDAQLLESRGFGIEEICRLYNTPPPLIGHTSKASSWASSIENLNLHYLMYRLNPQLVRDEASIVKKLLTPADYAAGIHPKFNVRGMLRASIKDQNLAFGSGLQNGYLNIDEVRDMMDKPPIPDGKGQEYRVQLNMTPVGEDPPDEESIRRLASEGSDK